jgi:hypothetical protein
LRGDGNFGVWRPQLYRCGKVLRRHCFTNDPNRAACMIRASGFRSRCKIYGGWFNQNKFVVSHGQTFNSTRTGWKNAAKTLSSF